VAQHALAGPAIIINAVRRVKGNINLLELRLQIHEIDVAEGDRRIGVEVAVGAGRHRSLAGAE